MQYSKLAPYKAPVVTLGTASVFTLPVGLGRGVRKVSEPLERNVEGEPPGAEPRLHESLTCISAHLMREAFEELALFG
jgi:hypothetical protein